jgi:hypothetical protein
MDDRKLTDPIEELVDTFLSSEAASVDGRKLLEQARRLQRARRARRLAVTYAVAAGALLAVTLFLVHSARKPTSLKPITLDLTPVTTVVREQQERVLGGMDAVQHAIVLPARGEFGSLNLAGTAAHLAPNWSEAGKSFRADAREIGYRFDALVSVSCRKAGLAL